MAKTTATISVTLRPELIRAVDKAAAAEQRTRSKFLDITLTRVLTGGERLADLEQIAKLTMKRGAP
jgi:uncharacterized protein (DUF1778 family)